MTGCGAPRHDGQDDCECICNHAGACTGCGICWIKAYYEHQDWAVRALFGLPGGLA